jgi:hypothetical protein
MVKWFSRDLVVNGIRSSLTVVRLSGSSHHIRRERFDGSVETVRASLRKVYRASG